MSAYVYGRIRRDRIDGVQVLASGDNKLVESLVAIIPVDVIALHAIVLALSTKTDETTGDVSITDESTLKRSVFVFFGLSIALFILGHLKTSALSPNKKFKWDDWDYLRMFLPALAFLAWAGLAGVSSVTPWIHDWSKGMTALVAGGLGIVVIATAAATSDS